jgi:hypothetical protein
VTHVVWHNVMCGTWGGCAAQNGGKMSGFGGELSEL